GTSTTVHISRVPKYRFHETKALLLPSAQGSQLRLSRGARLLFEMVKRSGRRTRAGAVAREVPPVIGERKALATSTFRLWRVMRSKASVLSREVIPARRR